MKACAPRAWLYEPTSTSLLLRSFALPDSIGSGAEKAPSRQSIIPGPPLTTAVPRSLITLTWDWVWPGFGSNRSVSCAPRSSMPPFCQTTAWLYVNVEPGGIAAEYPPTSPRLLRVSAIDPRGPRLPRSVMVQEAEGFAAAADCANSERTKATAKAVRPAWRA